MPKIKVILAEDHISVRDGFKILINSQSDMEVIGEAANGEEAISLLERITPDILVMDISMPKLNGLKATQLIRRNYPDVKILTLTRHKEDSFVRQFIKAGVSGYVLKQSASAELIRAIRHIAAGDDYIDPTLTKTVFGGLNEQSDSLRGEVHAEPTPREAEVLQLVARGYSNKEIAAQFDLSVKTIETHKANAMRKMNMKNRIDIVRYAILQEWLDND